MIQSDFLTNYHTMLSYFKDNMCIEIEELYVPNVSKDSQQIYADTSTNININIENEPSNPEKLMKKQNV